MSLAQANHVVTTLLCSHLASPNPFPQPVLALCYYRQLIFDQ